MPSLHRRLSVFIPFLLLLPIVESASGGIPATLPTTAPAGAIDFSCVGFRGNGLVPPIVPAVLLFVPRGMTTLF